MTHRMNNKDKIKEQKKKYRKDKTSYGNITKRK